MRLTYLPFLSSAQAAQEEFRNTLSEMMGSENAGSVLTVRDENVATDKPFIKVDQLGSPIDKDLYRAYVEPLRKDIAIAAHHFRQCISELFLCGLCLKITMGYD